MTGRPFLTCLLTIVVLAAGVAAKKTDWPSAPIGSVMAWAKLTSPDKTSTGKGIVYFIWPRSDKGAGKVVVNLSGEMVNVTMAHIHESNATAGNPIRLDLLPRVLGTKPALLDPPVSYKGAFSFTTPFTSERLAEWDSANDSYHFLQLLKKGLLYVNVHTTAKPAGEVKGKLTCKAPCIWMLCGASPDHPC